MLFPTEVNLSLASSKFIFKKDYHIRELVNVQPEAFFIMMVSPVMIFHKIDILHENSKTFFLNFLRLVVFTCKKIINIKALKLLKLKLRGTEN